jgi:hypothetical protein
MMKRQSILTLCLCLALAWLLVGVPAQAGLIVSFDENGNGFVTRTTDGVTRTLTSLGNVVDPIDPAFKPLGYDLMHNALVGGTPVSDGDFIISENSAILSDIVRFEKGMILVYSEKGDDELTGKPDLADVGITTSRIIIPGFTPTLDETGPEGVNGIFNFTPTNDEPGFMVSPPGPVTYNFFSDGSLPEPASIFLLGIGGALGVGYALRRRQVSV